MYWNTYFFCLTPADKAFIRKFRIRDHFHLGSSTASKMNSFVMLLFISWKMEYKKRLNAIFMRLKAFLMALENLEDDPFSQKNTFFRKIYRNTKMSRIFSFVGHETSFVWKYSSGNDKNEPTMTSKGVFGQKLDNFAWTKCNIYTIYCIYQLCFRTGFSTAQPTWIAVLDTFMDINGRDYDPIELFFVLYGCNGIFTALDGSYVLNILYNWM